MLEYEQPKKRGTALVMAATILLSGAFGFGGGYLANSLNAEEPSITTQYVYQDANQLSTGSAYNSEMSISDIAALTADTVVEISTEQVQTNYFMGQYISQGAGSGVIMSKDGYIITNNHVIEGASKITVRTKSGDEYEARLIGKDSTTDIAVIKIEAKNLNATVFGDSDKLMVGELAVAIGNPLGQLGGTVSEGIISALNRDIYIDGASMNLLQTTAAVNPGNSGGALFNGRGELIGIVNAKSMGSDIEGIGFAIPINTAKTVADELINYGYVRGRIEIGISLVDISDANAAMTYRVQNYGTYIMKVNRADIALQAGDRIISIDGKVISTSQDIKSLLGTKKVGDVLKFSVQRGLETMDISVTLQEQKNG